MIGRADLNERVRQWGLREDVVEKDYVLGWLLWAIGSDPTLTTRWVFKGGTCLKKCYIETYRFSEDLDFTVLPGGPIDPDDVAAALRGVLAAASDASGIDLVSRDPLVRARPQGRSTEVRVYYLGPRLARTHASVKLDLNADEKVVRPSVLREIAHPYPDGFPSGGRVRCYSFEEVFAEKIRAMGERGAPRDLYDIVNLFRRPDLRQHPDLVRAALVDKCNAKGVAVPSLDSLSNARYRAELESEWANMLDHQLPALPPVEQFLAELPALFDWLAGTSAPALLAPMALAADEVADWTPPSTVATWRTGVPLEVVRFAAANRLCVDLGYQGSHRVIEPYSLRMTQAGNIILHALRADSRQHRSYRIDQIQSVAATNRPFIPVYAVELSASGPLVAAPTARGGGYGYSRPRTSSRSTGPVYLIQCPMCNKTFRRKTRDTTLRPHKSPEGWQCSGRRGYSTGMA